LESYHKYKDEVNDSSDNIINNRTLNEVRRRRNIVVKRKNGTITKLNELTARQAEKVLNDLSEDKSVTQHIKKVFDTLTYANINALDVSVTLPSLSVGSFTESVIVEECDDNNFIISQTTVKKINNSGLGIDKSDRQNTSTRDVYKNQIVIRVA